MGICKKILLIYIYIRKKNSNEIKEQLKYQINNIYSEYNVKNYKKNAIEKLKKNSY